jgi:hypothetical protein
MVICGSLKDATVAVARAISLALGEGGFDSPLQAGKLPR